MKHVERLLDELHLQDLQNRMHPSIFDENDEYNMLILRVPVIAEKLEGKSFGFVFQGENSFLYNKEEKKFEKLDDPFFGPYKIIDPITDALLKSFQNYRDVIIDMEERLYQNKNLDGFMPDWIDLKRDLLLIERILTRTSEVLLTMIRYYEETTGFPINSYIDLHEHMERILSSATHHLSKLDYLYSFYSARANDKMNKMIYILTIISAIFLPLNLLVGFFGMNTSELPFTSPETNGTLYVELLILSLSAFTFAVALLWHRKTQKQ